MYDLTCRLMQLGATMAFFNAGMGVKGTLFYKLGKYYRLGNFQINKIRMKAWALFVGGQLKGALKKLVNQATALRILNNVSGNPDITQIQLRHFEASLISEVEVTKKLILLFGVAKGIFPFRTRDRNGKTWLTTLLGP